MAKQIRSVAISQHVDLVKCDHAAALGERIAKNGELAFAALLGRAQRFDQVVDLLGDGEEREVLPTVDVQGKRACILSVPVENVAERQGLSCTRWTMKPCMYGPDACQSPGEAGPDLFKLVIPQDWAANMPKKSV